MARIEIDRSKPYLNIGTINAEHKRAALTAAISKVLNDKYEVLNERNDPGGLDSGKIEYQTAKRHYAIVDATGGTSSSTYVLTGAAHMDGAILVVAATDGLMAQTREHVLLARQVGVPYLVVAIDKSDMVEDEELLDLVEMEVRELLSSQGFDGDDAPVVRVSGLKALEGDPVWVKSVEDLMEAVDESVPDPVRDLDKPFLMPIEDVFTITGRGTVVTGRAERGTLAINSEVEIVGIRPVQKTTVTGIEMFHKQLDEAWAGENCGLLLRGLKRDDVERGQVVVKPGSITPHTDFEASVYILSKDEGGRHDPFYSNYRPQFYFRTTDVTGVITLPEGTEKVMPGDNTEMTVELIQPIAMEEGLGFAIREGGRTVGSGRVTKVLDKSERRSNVSTQRHELTADKSRILEMVKREIVSKGVRVGINPPSGALSIEFDGEMVFPEFQFVSHASTILHEVVPRLSPLLGYSSGPVGAVSWWTTPNSWLGKCPADLLGTHRDEEIVYAATQIENDSW